VDNQVVEAIRHDALLSLIELPDQDVQNAAIDGLAPDYFGMIVATYSLANAQ